LNDCVVVILNPAARGEKARRLCEKIAGLSDTALLRITTAPGEARQLAREAVEEGCRTIVAAGGDGTINEVVNGIAGAPEVHLGVLPIGTMNVFATELGIPDATNLPACWEIITAGNLRVVDLPSANGHCFVQLGGIGLDAQVVQETSWEFKKNWGPLSYLISATQIASRPPPRLALESADIGTIDGSFVLVGNGRLYGGPFVLFNDAKVDDGKLDVLVFKNLGYLDIVRYLHAIIMGFHPDLHDVEYFQTSSLTVSSAEAIPVEVDGEVIGTVPITFSVAPRALCVFAPPPQD
jgi:diacylglycerol kinase (ATP)